MTKIIFLTVLFISVLGQAQTIDKVKINTLIDAQTGENDPGLFVGIVLDGKIVYERYRGLANLELGVEINEKTRSNIASIAKQFTALMVLQLALQERLSLDEDIRTYLPQLYSTVKEKISLRHLLNHTSGIRDYADLLSIQQNPWWRQVGLDNEDVISLLEKQEDLGFKPGARFIYSNSGYTILTKIIEKVTGLSFNDYSENFFQELGMKNTQFSESYMEVIPHKATPYSDWGDGVWKEYPMLTNLNGDGFLYTTLRDQLIFEKAIQYAKKDNNVLLINSQTLIPNSEITTYGYGLELEDRLNRKAVHHSGSTGSYSAQVVRYPKENLSIFVMSNNHKIWSGTIADEIANIVLGEKELIASYDATIESITQQNSVEDLVGQYRSPFGAVIRIQLETGKISWKMDNNNPIQLQEEKGNLYSMVGNSSTKVGFKVLEDGRRELVVFWPNGKTRVYSKIALYKPVKTDLEAFEGSYLNKALDVTFKINLNPEGKLMVEIDGQEGAQEMEVINRNDLLFSNYRMNVLRDGFNRVIGMSITTNRVLNLKFNKKTNLKFQPKVPTENGSIQVTTIGSRDGESSQILLTNNDANDNEIWSKQFGGGSYDKASSILATENGYLIIGSTSSFGNGNYDMFVIKTNKKGKKIWQNTYGNFFNEYGYVAEKVENGYLIKGTVQNCSSNTNVLDRSCSTNVWFVEIDENGKELSDQVLEEIVQ